jgi:aminodeoxyfutalosine deaminase
MITNGHTHLELGWLAELCPDPDGRDFVGWWQAHEDRRRKLAGMGCFVETTFRQAAEAGLDALRTAGVTHVADFSATGSSFRPLLDSGIQGIVYIEVQGLFAEQADRALAMARYVIEEARPHERNGVRVGLALPSPLTVHPSLWRKALAYAQDTDLPISIHIAESQAEYDWLLRDSGPLAELFRDQGIPLSSPRRSPIAYLEDLGALALQPLLVHAVYVDDDDVQRIQASGSRVVHCPRSNQRLRAARMPLERYLEAGVTVYLGSESLASSPSLDVQADADAAIQLHTGQVTPEDIQARLAQPL